MKGRVVLDSSAIAALFFREDVSDKVEEVVKSYSEYYTTSQAYSEVANVAWKRARNYGENVQLVKEALESAVDFINKACVVEDVKQILEDAFKLAIDCGITVYDALFVALAVKLNTRVITTDKKLYERLRGADLGLDVLQIVE